jgi:hypothetical protein
VRGVIKGQVRGGVGVTKIVDGDDLELVGAFGFIQRAQDVPADAAVTVDTYFNSHTKYSVCCGTKIKVNL